MVVMTKVTTPVIGWICSILGWVINGIYTLLDIVGIPNIGLAIILFTFVDVIYNSFTAVCVLNERLRHKTMNLFCFFMFIFTQTYH